MMYMTHVPCRYYVVIPLRHILITTSSYHSYFAAALVANLFMDAHSLTRTLTSAMEVLERFLWLMLGPTQMAVNSSSAPQTLHGSTENTLCSERLQREWMSYERWRAWEVKVVAPGLRLRFPHQGLFKTILSIYNGVNFFNFKL